MERVSTGFPELDTRLGAGLACPSCICVSGQFHLSQRNFILQMTSNFLQSGRKGLYVCLDRPASEVRSNFKNLGLNIDDYDKNYSLFFIDFFTYSQNALIENANLRALEYTPRLLLDTLSPFLDWIRNGFIIIDSLSTLMLNMESKEAYEFTRGMKLIGRAFNLITVGITHIPVAELESVVSNSDGNLQFKDETLYINRFENVNNESLQISTDKDGKISFKSPFSDHSNEFGGSILAALADTRQLKFVPTLKLTPTNFNCSAKALIEQMKPLEEQNMISKTPDYSTVCCSQCNSTSLEVYMQCPNCQNRVLEKGEVWEHFKCGNVGFEESYHQGDKLVCRKCNTPLKQIGVDYRRVGVGYQCANKHVVAIPKIVFVCTECKTVLDVSTAKLQTQYSYELTEKGKRQAAQANYTSE